MLKRKYVGNNNNFKRVKAPFFSSSSSTNLFRRVRRRMAILRGGWFRGGSTGNVERKYVDVQLGTGDYNLAGTNTRQSVCLVAQGGDANQRVGRKITVKSCQIRLLVDLPTTATSGGVLRTVLVYDKQPNGALASVTDILETDNAVGLINLDNRQRFDVLMDEFTPMSVSGPETVCISRYIKMNRDIIYNSTTTAGVGAITTGNFILLTSQYGVLTTQPSDIGRIRFRFVDV